MADPERAENFFKKPDRFDRFTNSARRVLSLAQVEAHRFNHNYIGTEHLLLGLTRLDENDPALNVLKKFNVETNQVRSTIEFIIGRVDRPVHGEVGLTPRAKKVIELAAAGAREFKHHYLGTEHLLLGLVDEKEGIAAGVLETLGVTPERVRIEIRHVLSETTQPELLLDAKARTALFAWWENFFNNPEIPESLKIEELAHLQERLKEAKERSNKQE